MYFALSLLPPLGKGPVLSFVQTWISSFCQVWLKFTQWFWRRRWKCKKFTEIRPDRRTTDNRRSEKLTWAFSLGELKKTPFHLKIQIMQLHFYSLINDLMKIKRISNVHVTSAWACYKYWMPWSDLSSSLDGQHKFEQDEALILFFLILYGAHMENLHIYVH